ncbi:MAG: 3'-5' exonuclease [Opitutaceae bacterium]
MKISFLDAQYYLLSGFAFSGFSKRRYVVFDVESTGIDHQSESVTQIGAVAVYASGPRDTESFKSLVKPWKPIPDKIEKLTGITNIQLADAAEFPAVWPEFIKFCGNSPLVTQCGYEFDFPILDQECARAGVSPLGNPRLDTKALFALLHPERSEVFSTNFLSDHYRADRSRYQRHDALGDAQLISRVFHGELQELQRAGVDSLRSDSAIRIKRFILPPL